MESFESALHESLDFPPSPTRMFLREFDGLQGRADLVDAHIHTQALPDVPSLRDLSTALTSPTKARLLAILRYGAPRTRDHLARATGLSNRSLGSHIRQLESVGLVEVHRSSAVSLGCRLPWGMVDIVAYEGKLSNWRRALHQALGYRSFSRSVWVVVPASRTRHAKKLATVFQTNGIGLMAIEDDGNMHIEIRSKQHRRPASRRFYLMAVGAVLNRFVEGKGVHTPAEDLNRSSASNH